MVKTVSSGRADRPFTISVLPRRSRRGRPIPNAHRPKAADESVTVDGIAVTDDVTRGYTPTIGLSELIGDPFCGRICSDAKPVPLGNLIRLASEAESRNVSIL